MICGAAARRHFLLRAAALFDFNERIPMTDIIDIHTHSIASMHAYSTIREIATMAKEKGLALVGISDHAPALPGTFHEMYFRNFKVIRPAAYGIDIIMGAELNIMDYEGGVDLPERVLQKMHYAIASLHDVVRLVRVRRWPTLGVDPVGLSLHPL